jgi:Site-specific DNA methylase
MKIKGFSAYYGGKGTAKIQAIIQPLIPDYQLYCEPFAGAASTWAHLENYRGTVEVLNDQNKMLINLYRTIQSPWLFKKLLIEVQGTLHSQADFKRALKIYLNPKWYHSRVMKAWATWAAFNMSHAADPSPGSGLRFDSKAIRAAKNKEANHIHSSKKNFSKLASRLERVTIMCMDALDLITKVDRPGAFFFVDPPYEKSDQGNFAHMGWTRERLIELMEVLSNLQGKFLLSYNLTPELEAARIKNGWQYKDVALKNAITINENGKKKSFIKKRIEAFSWNFQEPNRRLF